MTKVANITAVETTGGFYFDDKEAIVANAERDGFLYKGEVITAGFTDVRQPAEAASVIIELEDGRTGLGDCTAVQYSGFGGRDTVFTAEDHLEQIETTVSEALAGQDAREFTTNVEILSDIAATEELHTAVRYGVSQALLDAAATASGQTMTEVIGAEYSIDRTPKPVPIYCQSGSDRRRNAEKMILKEVPVLPHGLFNSVAEIGPDGERLLEYLEWLSDRVTELSSPEYDPTFHVDIYGTVGEIFSPPYDRNEVIDYFAALGDAASPYSLQVESPIEAGSRDDQIRVLGTLRDALTECSIPVDIIADEFCNTYDDVTAFVDAGAVDVVQIKTPDLGEITASIDAVQYCENTDTRAYLGGSCAETDVSARVCAQIALATQPAQILAKPGMGVDEGYQIVANEMARTSYRINS
ncbi:methylaspartate ammonia-lyase [Salinadaptatus halalkaliphilus]|uniref:methylaspartate ammonia-lyase n=1 Tax=Salinadaptatus halalkaliphilus TaxID=2419781 RepID=A0A4S3TH07_9EURY|nr:methylaspartate ammonia-lyase [Salinadaptatus halalkaliphilus]THE63181.1 methylaspartate ammonia-lyase [Salinadaptatus halalkaliphilus]